MEGAYDEMVAAPGVLRPHCEGFVRSVEALGRHEFTSRWEGAKRSIREKARDVCLYVTMGELLNEEKYAPTLLRYAIVRGHH